MRCIAKSPLLLFGRRRADQHNNELCISNGAVAVARGRRRPAPLLSGPTPLVLLAEVPFTTPKEPRRSSLLHALHLLCEHAALKSDVKQLKTSTTRFLSLTIEARPIPDNLEQAASAPDQREIDLENGVVPVMAKYSAAYRVTSHEPGGAERKRVISVDLDRHDVTEASWHDLFLLLISSLEELRWAAHTVLVQAVLQVTANKDCVSAVVSVSAPRGLLKSSLLVLDP